MAREIENVAIVGAGVMGAQIGQVLAASGFDITLHDVSESQLDAALERIEHSRFGLRKGVERGKITSEQVDEALARISTTTDLGRACQNADLVIEAVPEEIGLKIDVFRRLDELAPPHAILASNTAGLPITALAHAIDRPGQVIGWHWFQPCAVMRLAELITHDGTFEETRDAVVRAAEKAGRVPVVVKDQPMIWGFVGNRINRAVRVEAARIVEEGIATEEQVNTIMKEGFRWPMGPFELLRGGSLS
jgi:3-hydroxybutyryl-CoA dehydrogenase